MRQELNFNHLECFFTLAKLLSFSQTAQELKIAQPAVSNQIKSLESYFQKQLFLRSKQNVYLTSAGKEIYQQLYPLYNELCSRSNMIKQDHNEISGKMVIGCLREVGERIFIPALNNLIQAHPKINLDVRFLKSKEIVEGVKKGNIHLGIVAEKMIQEKIRTYKIFNEKIILVTNPVNKKRDIFELSSIPMVSYGEVDPLLNYFMQKRFPRSSRNKIERRFVVNSHKSMIEVLRQNHFYAVLPYLSVEKELKQKHLINVGLPELKTNLFMIYADVEYIDPKIMTLSSYLRSFIREQYPE